MTAQEAHLRMMEETPRERIHTHEWKPISEGWGKQRTPEQVERLKIELKDLEARGYTRRQMQAICGCTNATVIKHCGKVGKGRKKAKK